LACIKIKKIFAVKEKLEIAKSEKVVFLGRAEGDLGNL
jgi:hypothetical protein